MIQSSTVVRNAALDSHESAIGASAKIQIWSGGQPASCAAAATGVLLAEWVLAADWAAPAVAGSKSLLGVPLQTLGLAAGVAGHYRITESTGATCHEQGSISANGGGGDMEIDSTNIGLNQPVQITQFTKTAPGA